MNQEEFWLKLSRLVSILVIIFQYAGAMANCVMALCMIGVSVVFALWIYGPRLQNHIILLYNNICSGSGQSEPAYCNDITALLQRARQEVTREKEALERVRISLSKSQDGRPELAVHHPQGAFRLRIRVHSEESTLQNLRVVILTVQGLKMNVKRHSARLNSGMRSLNHTNRRNAWS